VTLQPSDHCQGRRLTTDTRRDSEIVVNFRLLIFMHVNNCVGKTRWRTKCDLHFYSCSDQLAAGTRR